MAATITTPARTLLQRKKALERANEIRTHRAKLKRRLNAQTAISTIAAPDDLVASMHVYTLLLAVPSMGRVKANKLLRHCAVSPSKTIGGLSDRQRTELLAGLRTWAR